MMMTVLSGGVPENKETVRQIYEVAINQSKRELLPEIMAANVADLAKAFSELKFTISELIGEGDLVAVRWTWTGRHTGAFRGHAASNVEVKNSGISIYKFRDGKIVSVELEADRLGVLQQIGAIPKK